MRPLFFGSLVLALAPRSAAAETRCVDVDTFNAEVGGTGGVSALTVAFDITGVNPGDYPDSKGGLSELTDSACPGSSLALKVYGPAAPPNTAHPPGTLKQEANNPCGPTPGEESWSSPNPSDTVFTDGGEVCEVYQWVAADTFGYRLDCEHGSFEAVGHNDQAWTFDRVTLLSLADGHTWRMDNAASTWNEVCYEPVADGGDSGGDAGGDDGGGEPTEASLTAVADVTVAVASPDTVYPDVTDLSIGADDSEAYLRFDTSSQSGTVVSAVLVLTALPDSWAEGSGVEVWKAGAAGWSEDTLTWSGRPGTVGAALDRVAPVAASDEVRLDVTEVVAQAVAARLDLSLALVPRPSDTNGVHFASKEYAAGLGPRLELVLEEGGNDDGGGGGGPGDTAEQGDSGEAGREADVALAFDSGCGCQAVPRAATWCFLAAVGLVAGRRRSRP